MMWFWFGLMILVALWFVLPPLRKGGAADAAIDSNMANVAILQEQLSELGADFANDELAEARMELETSVAAELVDVPPSAAMPGWQRLGLASLLAVFLSVGSLVLYQGMTTFRSSPATVNAEQAAGEQALPLAEMAEVLAARLRQSPDDARGWHMMGKTYMLLNRAGDAVDAYDTAHRLTAGKDADLLADYAEALAYVNGHSMLGRPAELVNAALQINAGHAKSLWLAGFAAMHNKAYAAAINHWQGLLGNADASEETRTLARQYVSRARELAGDAGSATGTVSGRPALSVAVRVSLDRSLSAKVADDEVVYVFARPGAGRSAPLAVRRLTVADLPTTVVLDDSMAMLSGNNLSSHDQVVIGARVSRAGTPVSQTGDLEGLGPVIDPRVTKRQAIVISRVVN